MTIIEALKISDKVKRDSWCTYIDLKKNGILSREDISATDWQPYEQEKEKCEACKEAENNKITSYIMFRHLRQFHCTCGRDK